MSINGFDVCKKICSNISFIQFERYLEALFQDNLQGAILILQEIYEYGYSVIDILDYFFTFMKSTPMLSEDQKYKIIPIICKYITIFHNIHEESIELALFTNEVLQVTGNQGAPQGWDPYFLYNIDNLPEGGGVRGDLGPPQKIDL